MKVVVNALTSSLKPLGYTLCIFGCLIFMYGIFGMYLFMGLFWRCNDSLMSGRDTCVGHFVSPGDNLLRPRLWINPPFGFDDILSSCGTLFEVATLKAWTEKLQASTDVTKLYQQPEQLSRPLVPSLFYIFFIIISNFFLMKLFVGIVVASFRRVCFTAFH